MTARMNPLEQEAQKVSGIDNWFAWSFEAAQGGIICKGGVCPPVTRGPRKGEPNYRKADPSTVMTVIVNGSDRPWGEPEEWPLYYPETSPKPESKS